MKIDQQMINNNQDYINFLSANVKFIALDNLIRTYGREFLTREDYDTEEECKNNYVLKAEAIRIACDVIEHYTKALLIHNGKSWQDNKSVGHNLANLFAALDSDSQKFIIAALEPNIKKLNQFNKNFNTSFNKILDDIIKIIQNSSLLGEKELNEKNYFQKSNKNDYEFSISNENIKYLKEGETVSGTIQSVESQSTRNNSLAVKSRYPGQTLVDADAEFLVSLAYVMKELCSKFVNVNTNSQSGMHI